MPYFGWALSSNFCGNPVRLRFTGCPVPKGSHQQRVAAADRQAVRPTATGRTVAILAENTPSGQYELGSLTAAAQSAKFKVVYGQGVAHRAGDASTTTQSAKAVLASNAAQSPTSVFVVGGPSNVLGMQQALRANGLPRRVHQPDRVRPDLVAPAIGAEV